MAQYQTQLSLLGAYCIDATLLQDVVERANAFLEAETTIEINFSHVHKLASSSLPDVVQDSLMRTNLITRIAITGSNYGVAPYRAFSFEAQSGPFSPTISVNIWGNQEPSRSLSSHIEGLLRAKRQWYSYLIIGPPALGSVMALSAVVGLVLAVAVGAAFIFDRPSTQAVALITLAGVTVWLWPVILFSRFLFQPLIVEIGRSAEIASQKRGIQKFLFGSVVAALIIGGCSIIDRERSL
jgi:hypothetical protein